MSSSDKSKRALGRWAIIIALVLMLAFLMSVATVSGAKPCNDKWSTLKKSPVQTTGIEDGYWVKKSDIQRLGISKWAYMYKDCKYGYTYKIFYDYGYCGSSKCMLLSSTTVPIGTWKSCKSKAAYFTYPIGYTPSGSPF